MTTREMATQYKMAQWRQIIQERAASGTSIAAFCRVRGIQRQSYFHWQKKLREAAAEQLSQVDSAESGSQALYQRIPGDIRHYHQACAPKLVPTFKQLNPNNHNAFVLRAASTFAVVLHAARDYPHHGGLGLHPCTACERKPEVTIPRDQIRRAGSGVRGRPGVAAGGWDDPQVCARNRGQFDWAKQSIDYRMKTLQITRKKDVYL